MECCQDLLMKEWEDISKSKQEKYVTLKVNAFSFLQRESALLVTSIDLLRNLHSN